MPTQQSPIHEEQLMLFQRRPSRPRWVMFPADVREEAIRLTEALPPGPAAREKRPPDWFRRPQVVSGTGGFPSTRSAPQPAG